VSWAIGSDDNGLRIYLSYADARRNGTHTNWSRPRLVLQQVRGVGDNGSLPRVAPDGTVWLATSSFGRGDEPLTMSVTSSRNGGRTWSRRRAIVRHAVNGYRNTTFRSAFGEAFAVGPRKLGRSYPLYAAYEVSGPRGTHLFLRGSFDGGKHWRNAIEVDDGPGAGVFGVPAERMDRVRDLLHLPEDVAIVEVITLGHPGADAVSDRLSSRATRPRKPIDELVRWETF
jgi:hypothetical protein